jgi:hypothetical protein
MRVYRCDNCDRIEDAISTLRSDYVQRNKFRLGALGASDIDQALAILTRKAE